MSGKAPPEPSVSALEKNIALLRVGFLVFAVMYLGFVIFFGQRSWFHSFRVFFWIAAALIFFPLVLTMIFARKEK